MIFDTNQRARQHSRRDHVQAYSVLLTRLGACAGRTRTSALGRESTSTSGRSSPSRTPRERAAEPPRTPFCLRWSYNQRAHPNRPRCPNTPVGKRLSENNRCSRCIHRHWGNLHPLRMLGSSMWCRAHIARRRQDHRSKRSQPPRRWTPIDRSACSPAAAGCAKSMAVTTARLGATREKHRVNFILRPPQDKNCTYFQSTYLTGPINELNWSVTE